MKKNYRLLVVAYLFYVCSFGQNGRPILSLTSQDFVKEPHNTTEQKKAVNDLAKINQRLLNFHPVNTFDIHTVENISKTIGNVKQTTVFTIYQLDDSNIERELWKIDGDESSIQLTTKQAINLAFSSPYDGGEVSDPLLNTYVQSTSFTKNNNGNRQGITLGSFSNDSTKIFKGVIAEVLVYNKVLRDKTKQSIATYLALKYGIGLVNGEDYLSSAEDVIYNVKDSPEFATRITGIGRDQKNKLYQKQSKNTSKEAALTIGFDTVALTNEENTSVLQNKSFVIWADNNGLIEHKAQNNEGFGFLEREWRIELSGKHTTKKTTQVILDLSEKGVTEGEPLKNYNLIINRRSTGDYSNENTESIEATSISNGKVLFDDILWDVDKSGSDRFTFYVKLPLSLEVANGEVANCESVNSNGSIRYKAKGGIAPYKYHLVSNTGYNKEWSQDKFSKEEMTIENLQDGVYTMKVTDASNTTFEKEYEIISPEQFVLDLGADKTFNYKQAEMLLTSSLDNDDAVKYEWAFEGKLIGTQRSIIATDPGLYQLTAKNTNGCISIDDINLDSELIRSYVVFPNYSPNGHYTIDVSLSKKQDISVKIFDMTGSLLSTMNAKNQKTYTLAGEKIDTSGVYLVVLEAGSNKTSRKLIIK